LLLERTERDKIQKNDFENATEKVLKKKEETGLRKVAGVMYS
jgi:ATP-dependent 26S proteasome regulatory subunit